VVPRLGCVAVQLVKKLFICSFKLVGQLVSFDLDVIHHLLPIDVFVFLGLKGICNLVEEPIEFEHRSFGR
jgi:hypothetical protein